MSNRRSSIGSSPLETSMLAFKSNLNKSLGFCFSSEYNVCSNVSLQKRQRRWCAWDVDVLSVLRPSHQTSPAVFVPGTWVCSHTSQHLKPRNGPSHCWEKLSSLWTLRYKAKHRRKEHDTKNVISSSEDEGDKNTKILDPPNNTQTFKLRSSEICPEQRASNWATRASN